MAKTKLTPEIMSKVVEKFNGAKVAIRKFYTKAGDKVTKAFYVATIKLKNGDSVSAQFTDRSVDLFDAWVYFIYDGYPLAINFDNDESCQTVEDHHFNMEILWINEHGANESVGVDEKNISFIDGNTGKPIDFGVNANLWSMKKAPACYQILSAWPKRIG